MGERFQNLCLDDKIRLQTLIRELAYATQAVQEKENVIKDLENKLKIEETSKVESESHRKVTLEKFENTEKQFSAYKCELESRQAEIAAQIAEAKEKILEIRKQRKIERKQFKEKEKILKEEIEFHIDTARSTETRAEKFQNELERLQEVTKCEIGAQTSFIFPDEIVNGKNENSRSKSFNTSQLSSTSKKSSSKMSETLEREQKKLADLVEQQNQLLENAVKFRTLMEEKIQKKASPETSFDVGSEPSDISILISHDISERKDSNLTTPRHFIDLIDELEKAQDIPDLDETERLVDLIDELDLNIENSNLSAFSSDLESDPILADLFFRK